jgi:hypothetical protein
MTDADDLYAFAFRGALAEDSAHRALELDSVAPTDLPEKIAQKMPLDLLDKNFILSASKMASVYTAIASFENSARKFIQDRLLEKVGADWWLKRIPENIRKEADRRKKDEEQIRWHGARGSSMIFYTQMDDLPVIIQNNFAYFEDYIESVEWARQIFKSLERSRNVIMHSGELSMNDIERVAMNIRDWIRQVGG